MIMEENRKHSPIFKNTLTVNRRIKCPNYSALKIPQEKAKKPNLINRIVIDSIKRIYGVKDHRELYLKYFIEYLSLENKKISVCDVGGADGWAISYKSKYLIEKVVIDPNKRYEKIVGEKDMVYINTVLGSARFNIKERFNIVILNHVIEHIQDYQKAIEDIKQMLKEGGFVIVICPDIKKARWNFWNDPTHLKPYSKFSIEYAFKGMGFETINIANFSYEFFMLGFLFPRNIHKPYFRYGKDLIYIGRKV